MKRPILRPRSNLQIPNGYVVLFDILLVAASVIGAFALRLDLGALFVYYRPQMWWMVGLAIIIKPLVYRAFGLYRRVWVYASIMEMLMIIVASTLASIILGGAVFILTSIQKSLPSVHYIGFPRSSILIDWLLSQAMIGGFRFTLRVVREMRTARTQPSGLPAARSLIVGAGDAGALVAREMLHSSFIATRPVGFVDDDPLKQNQRIHNVPVLGTIQDLPRLVETKHIDEVVIAIPSASGKVLRRVTEACRNAGVPFRTMPGIYELIGGNVSVSRLRDVDIADLLRRVPAQMNHNDIGQHIKGRRVLVTGAGGSIGRELCRQIARWQPAALFLLGHGENSIFETLMELRAAVPDLSVEPVIADIRNIDRMHTVFETFRPELVFHAAAHKHVPLMEANVEEAITNNILGTRNVVDVCLSYDIERMTMISTDKAIRPTSVMGATKRIAELIVLDAAHRHQRRFSVVRFGNVLGSRGSVVPFFKQQIARGGPVTVTHPEMKRYFMTIPEAVHLVLQATALGQGGEAFVLRMGEQVRILDLAEDLIRLSGLEPGRDIEITFTGIRPGEKLSEELWDKWARYEDTEHPDIVRLAEEDILTGNALYRVVDDLIHLARQGERDNIIRMLDEVIPGAMVGQMPHLDIISYG
ncbi:MAG: nucleoside-diphosphate sugar epimerase/dehydratase [Anaerolineales bacterium]